MQNAHLRMGRLEYSRSTSKIETLIRVPVERYIGDKDEAHLLSVVGGDAEVGAIAAAVAETHGFELTFPDGRKQHVSLGEHASCYRGSLSLPGRKHPVRHLLAVSGALHANGTAGRLFLMNDSTELGWSVLASLLGVPADPRWSAWCMHGLAIEHKMASLDGIGCKPHVVHTTRDQLLERISDGLRSGVLPFPEQNGPIQWPKYTLGDALRLNRQQLDQTA